jgi:hypothetical protein
VGYTDTDRQAGYLVSPLSFFESRVKTDVFSSHLSEVFIVHYVNITDPTINTHLSLFSITNVQA